MFNKSLAIQHQLFVFMKLNLVALKSWIICWGI